MKAPWKYGKGDQEGYFKSNRLWQELIETLLGSNSYKIQAKICAISIKIQLFGSQLFVRENGLCTGIDEEMLLTTNVVTLIMYCIYQRDEILVIGEA